MSLFILWSYVEDESTIELHKAAFIFKLTVLLPFFTITFNQQNLNLRFAFAAIKNWQLKLLEKSGQPKGLNYRCLINRKTFSEHELPDKMKYGLGCNCSWESGWISMNYEYEYVMYSLFVQFIELENVQMRNTSCAKFN